MKKIDIITAALLIVGGLNWGLVAIARFDLVAAIFGLDLGETNAALHDLSRPVDALRSARAMLAQSGSVVITDEMVEDNFTGPATEMERYHYGWSVVWCLPGVMGDPQTAATGAVMRRATLRRYAREAGFRHLQTLPIEADSWRFYRLTP